MHLDAHRLTLAIHSRRHAVDLIDLYINLSTHPGRSGTASALLTSLGGFLQGASMSSVAISLYERALELETANAATLISLAGLYERQGSYDKALVYLEELLRHHADHREARLRLAINLERVERRTEGVEALERILVTSESDWILSLAYQELARLAVADGDPARGRVLLEEARTRLPRDPSLAVQLAYLADRVGAPGGPSRLAEALEANVRSSQPSPRSLYSRVSGEALAELRVSLADLGRQRHPLLAEALGRMATTRRSTP